VLTVAINSRPNVNRSLPSNSMRIGAISEHY
jgi:hypothetical protein